MASRSKRRAVGDGAPRPPDAPAPRLEEEEDDEVEDQDEDDEDSDEEEDEDDEVVDEVSCTGDPTSGSIWENILWPLRPCANV